MTREESAIRHHNALVFARQHLLTHLRWRDYLRAGNELPHDKIGGLEHHEKAIRELETICAALRELRHRLAEVEARLAHAEALCCHDCFVEGLDRYRGADTA